MALWGSNDNITTFGTIAVSGTTVTGTGTTFTSDVTVGQVIRVGARGGVGTHYGAAVITGITSDRVLTIDTTDGLSATSIAATSYYVTELPKEFKLKDYVDYELQFEKTLLDPIRFILQPIGWTPEPKASLEAFFG